MDLTLTPTPPLALDAASVTHVTLPLGGSATSTQATSFPGVPRTEPDPETNPSGIPGFRRPQKGVRLTP